MDIDDTRWQFPDILQTIFKISRLFLHSQKFQKILYIRPFQNTFNHYNVKNFSTDMKTLLGLLRNSTPNYGREHTITQIVPRTFV